MNEVWKDIDGYDDYQVSNMGRVKSLKYGKERILKPAKGKDGYLLVRLYKNNNYKDYYVHRLVAMVFTPNPNNLPIINHRDECKTNNNVNNLEWCTSQYNNTYGTRNERVTKAMTNGKLSKLVYQYTLDGEFIREWSSTNEVERQTGYDQGYISKCCNGKRQTAYGYKWSYAS